MGPSPTTVVTTMTSTFTSSITKTATTTATMTTTATTTTTATMLTTSTILLRLLWSSNFETGDLSQWNSAVIPNEPNGGASTTISSALTHSGIYSSYYSYVGSPNDQIKRAYPSENLTSLGIAPSNFEVDMWIYVPSMVNGTPVNLTDWVSFLSVWVNPGAWNHADPITINGNYQGTSLSSPQLQMSLEMLGVGVTESAPAPWPLNQWWELSLVGNLVPNPGASSFAVYQNGIKVLSWSGVMPTTGLAGGPVSYDGLSYLHAGLYAGPNQGTYVIYNDDIAVYSMS